MQKIAWVMVLVLMAYQAKSCDVCGCGASNNQLGILPKFQKNFIGFKTQYIGFESRSHHSNDNSIESKEQFIIAQLWGRYVLSNRIHLFAFLPYKISQRSVNNITTNVQGIGDASLMANIIIINIQKDIWKQALQIGGGVKLPTGKYKIIEDGLLLHSNIQPGTGSIDIPMNMQYTLRYKAIGMNAEMNYTVNGSNKMHNTFGNKSTSTLRFFAWKQIKNISILPNIGISYEHAQKDFTSNELQQYTGGNSTVANIGLDLYYKNIGLNLLFQKSVSQNLGDGYIQAQPRLAANISYLF